MISKYDVLAKKYRPHKFSDLVGQDVLVRVLLNSIKSGKIANAFLLTGIRGVGKTSTARIIAKALNCLNIVDSEPCNQCSSCIDIMNSVHPDIIEIDAASYTGVDDVRTIIDNTRYVPSTARFKVYIIDECHMLSKSAMNALLKSLEEPMERVKFILATTDSGKVPDTVASRCQRFFLNRVASNDLLNHLNNIIQKEGIDLGHDSLKLIASRSDGSVRDALSILEKVIIYSGDTKSIKIEEVYKALGFADLNKLLDVVRFVIESDPIKLINAFDDLYYKGCDIAVILEYVLNMLHILTRQSIKADNKYNDDVLSKSEIDFIKLFCDKVKFSKMTRLWQSLLKGIQEVKTSPCTHAAASMVLLRLCYVSNIDFGLLIKSRGRGSHERISNFSQVINCFDNSEKHKDIYLILKSCRIDECLTNFDGNSIVLTASCSVPDNFTSIVRDRLRSKTGDDWDVVLKQHAGENDVDPSFRAQSDTVKELLEKFEKSRIVE